MAKELICRDIGFDCDAVVQADSEDEVMAQAATIEGVEPRSISFKATLQVLEAFRPLIAYRAHCGADSQEELYEQLLGAIAVHRVADRPDRYEPRMTKKGPRGYESLKRPRREIKLQMLKRSMKI